ncbi:YceK/YidQ family lipoprotein [Pseudomonas sp. GD03860]|uniref:YceK/YidQ family lipoprotein n=1 Tax=Pseudomonas TaxID=286 RepID=UPI0023631EA6|nr:MULTISPECIES: YceK/YidQ family lipoprotein [Pseudomonas]MDD2058266.1 YceK/YidQ family lipoprotein [Pseudomonas putida]MDH0636199.1 YceK/YidQ family lipoprotein [Pseudomonas sp. GD03860]
MKSLALSLLPLFLTGCGTINTVFKADEVASNELARWQSHCDAVPRIYSGAILDFCALHAEPGNSSSGYGRPSAELMLVDMLLSGVADTVVLPYTLYLQSRDGSIPKRQAE